ncbi:MAG: DUF4097 domain-containing protein [Tissierellales bacterium]|jgi:DUF4097 and DUF4098 domain-containing protein YvlB|nr:DUF4097 domain-containing protein [Tissierellales bacterium]
MSNERLMILQMLEDGKINNKQALELLEALDEDILSSKVNLEKNTKTNDDNLSSNGYSISFDDGSFEKSDFEKNDQNSDSQSEPTLEEKFERFGNELGESLENLGSHLENWGDSFGKKMESWGDSLDKDLANNAKNYGNSFTNAFKNLFNSATPFYKFESREHFDVLENDELYFAAFNGKINVKASPDSKGHIKVLLSGSSELENPSKSLDYFVNFKREDNGLHFEPTSNAIKGCELNIELPKNSLKKLHLITSNGKIVIENISAKNLICTSSNGKIQLYNISGSSLICKTSNGRIVTELVHFTNQDLNTSNGKIECSHFDYAALETLALKTSNGKIVLDMPPHPAKPYSIDLNTSMGKLDLGDFEWITDYEKRTSLGLKHFRGSSKGFDVSNAHVTILAKTTNGNIILE